MAGLFRRPPHPTQKRRTLVAIAASPAPPQFIGPSAISSAEAFGSHTLRPGAVIIGPVSIADLTTGSAVVYDTFTDVTNTSLDAHTPDVAPSGGWVGFTTGDIFINASDQAVAIGEHVGGYIQSGISDGVLSATIGAFNEVTDTRLGIHFRATNADEWADHWTAFVYRSADGGFRQIGLEHSVAGVGTEDWVVDPGDISAAGPHELKVEFYGASIKVYWNGVQQGTTTASNIHLTNTKVGISFANGGFGYFDNFQLLSIVSAAGVGTPTLRPTKSILPTAIASGEAVGSHTLRPGAVRILPSAIDSAESVGTPTLAVAAGPRFIQPSSINNYPEIRGVATAVATGTQTSIEVAVPVGTQNGDFLLILVWLSSPTATITLPGGWTATSLRTSGSSSSSHFRFGRRQASNEPASYTVTHASGISAAAIVATRGVNADSLAELQVGVTVPNTVAELGVDLGGTGNPVPVETLVLWAAGGRIQPDGSGATWTPDGSTTEIADVSSAVASVANSTFELSTEILPPGTVPARTFTAGGVTSIDWVGAILVFAPEIGLSQLRPPALLPDNYILPTAIPSDEAFGTPTLKTTARILPTAIDGAEVFGSHTLFHGGVNILPSAIASAEAFGSHILKAVARILPTAIDSAEAVGSHTLIPGGVRILPTAIASAEAVGSYTLKPTNVIAPSAIASAEAFGTPTLLSTARIQPTAIPSDEAFGAHTLYAIAYINPTAIPSDEAVGTPTLSFAAGPQTILPTAIDSAEAVGSHTLKPTNVILPTAIDTAEAFGSHTLKATASILPTAIASDEAIGSHTLKATATIIPSAITSAEAFGSHTLLHGGVFIIVSAIDSAESVGVPVLSTGVQNIFPTAIDSAEASGTPTLIPGNVNIQPTAVDSAESVGTPSLVATAQIIVSGIPSSETFGTPTLYSIAYINPSAVPSDEAVGTPTLIAAAGFIYPSSIDSAEAFGTPSLIAGAVQIIPTAIPTAESVSQPTLTSTATVSPTAIGSQEALGTPSIIPGAVTIQPNGVPTDENVGVPSLLAGGVTIQPAGISTEELFGLPEFIVTATIVPEGAASAEALGFPILVPGAVTISPSGIPSQEAVGDPAFANVLVGWNWVSRSPGWKTTKNRGWD